MENIIKMNRTKFNEYKAQGKAIAVQGQYLITLENGDMIPVKITGQVNYKGTKPNSYSPVNVEGVNK